MTTASRRLVEEPPRAEQFDEVDEASPHDPSRVAAATPAHELGKYVCALPLCGGRSFSGEHGLLNHMRDARAHKELPADHPLSSSRAAVLAPRRRDAAAAFAKKATSGNTAGTKKKRVLEEDLKTKRVRRFEVLHTVDILKAVG